MTPEGKVKAQVKAVLFHHGAWAFWPVQSGYGSYALDCIGCHKGRCFGIETKAPGKKPTAMQRAIGLSMQAAGATVFFIDGPTGLEEFNLWLSNLTA